MIAYGTAGAMAQERMMPRPDQQPIQTHSADDEDAGAAGKGGGMQDGMMGGMQGGGMMGGGMMGRRAMMGGGAMSGSPIMFRIIFALADSDGNGTISLQEFQAAHERIFKAMDTNKDGQLTPEEMQAFMHGGMRSAPQQ
jgi:hypothetical protein